MDIRGKLLKKSAIEQKTETFKVQEFYLDCSTFDQYTGEKRENLLRFQVTNAKIDKFQSVPVGAIVKVSFGIRGRFFDGMDKETGQTKKMHGQNLDAYAFEVIEYPQQQPPTEWTPAPQEQNPSYQPQQTSAFNSYGQAPAQNQEDDEMPF
ncbi:DUF3127 domain-containing protein [Capnocytophaga canimorsus]|uniref:DUF3127 domain-containing protein n=1 Tax=Capnocytophaga canimorsus TaxID=28188 RepID=UPI00384B8295